MATLHQYFETDFSHAARVHVKVKDSNNDQVESVLFYDFAGHVAFLGCYIIGESRSLQYFVDLAKALEYGKTQMEFDGRIYLPSIKQFPGKMQIRNKNPLEMLAQFHGDPDWISIGEIGASRRLFMYSETQLAQEEIRTLKRQGRDLGHEIQFRSQDYVTARSRFETPLAFIAHDSRDKDEVARKVAVGLQRMMCPVWYDEFSLKVGDNLRDRIELGLKTCKKCVIVLSENFFSNNGWTKKEFDSIFTREILEERQLVLPIWCRVTKEQVFQYSPSLMNVKGVSWDLGEDEVCRQLYRAIDNQSPE